MHPHLTISELSKLAQAVVDEMYTRIDPEWLKFGDVGKEKCVRDTEYVLAFLGQALEVDEPVLFLHFVDWIKAVFESLALPEDAFPMIARAALTVLERTYPDERGVSARVLLERGLTRHQTRTSPEPTHLTPTAPLYELATSYLECLLRYERHAAQALILRAAERGTSVPDLYQYVFEPCQRELGRLWQMLRISVAQEHYCTAATQLIMSQLHPYIFKGNERPRTMMAMCISGELHEVGARMVADLFELAGWNSHYVGANTPAPSAVKMTEELKPQLLCVSATLTYHVSAVRDLIRSVRASEAGQCTQILVGGYPFLVAPSLWQKVGADGSAPNAVEAVVLAERLVPQVNA